MFSITLLGHFCLKTNDRCYSYKYESDRTYVSYVSFTDLKPLLLACLGCCALSPSPLVNHLNLCFRLPNWYIFLLEGKREERGSLLGGSATGIKIEQYFLSAGSIWMSTNSEKAWLIAWHDTRMTMESWRTLKELKAFLMPLLKLKTYHGDPSIIYPNTLRVDFSFGLRCSISEISQKYTSPGHYPEILDWLRNIPVLWILPISLSLSPSFFQYFRISSSIPVFQCLGEHWTVLGLWSQHPKSHLKSQESLEQTVFCQSSKQDVYPLSWRKSQV